MKQGYSDTGHEEHITTQIMRAVQHEAYRRAGAVVTFVIRPARTIRPPHLYLRWRWVHGSTASLLDDRWA